MSIGSVVSYETDADRVIVIDDSSTDRTAEGADIIVTMDSDGQHNPVDIPKLIAPILEGEDDIVNGSRYLNGHTTVTHAYRRICQTILDKITIMNCDNCRQRYIHVTRKYNHCNRRTY